MLYLLYGTERYQIEKEIKKIEKKFNQINISNYNLETDDITNILDDCETISLFSTNKLIIVDDATIFSKNIAKDLTKLENYLKNPNPNTTIVFIVNNEKIDSRKKITKAIKEKGQIKEYNRNLNIPELVKKELKNYTITPKTINLLISRVGDNPQILLNEIEKIKIYKEDNIITDKDIINLTHKKIDIDIFNLIDNIVQNKKDKALETYNEMLKLNEEPIKIIIMLSNQFRLMYQSKKLLKKGLTEKDIATTLKVHPYRVKLALQNSRTYSPKLLLKFINDLADIDVNIKTGKTNKKLALELFIIAK